MKTRFRSWLSLGTAGVCSASASGVVIHLNYDASVNALPNPAQFKAAVAYGAHQFENRYRDNIDINITIVASPDPNILGMSDSNIISSISYTAWRNAMIADAKTADDSTAVASLPASNPSGSGVVTMAVAEAKSLGLFAAHASGNDGTVTLGTTFTYTYDPANRAVGGAIDFIGVVMHEVSEVMGRFSFLPTSGTTTTFTPYDFFRYTAHNVRNLVTPPASPPVFFSIDSGVTNIKTFNSNPNGDFADWAVIGADSFNWAANFSTKEPLSVADQRAMDVLGYDFSLACLADFNRDNQVDDADFVIFASAYNLLVCVDPTMPAGCPADLNMDGLVDDSDFVIFANEYDALICP